MSTKIYYNDGDDIELVATLTDKEGAPIDPKSINWRIMYYVNPDAAVTISSQDGQADNCEIIGNEIHVYINKHTFGKGSLLVRSWYSFPNDKFEDGTQDVSTLPSATGIIMI